MSPDWSSEWSGFTHFAKGAEFTWWKSSQLNWNPSDWEFCVRVKDSRTQVQVGHANSREWV